MFPSSASPETFPRRLRLVGMLLALLLACGIIFSFGSRAYAAAPIPCCGGGFNPSAAVTYAGNHAYWTYYDHSAHKACYDGGYTNCYSTKDAKGGQFQPDFQCAEFVARALAAAGYMPGLNPWTSTQGAFGNYQPGDGNTYDLNLVTSIPNHHTLEHYLTTYGLAKSVGTSLGQASPGDVVVFENSSGQQEHMAMIISVGSDRAHTWVDTHNTAHLQVSLKSEVDGFASFYILHLKQ
ncbi:MAG TPA: amidase domain-containing protein [Ktedonobacteraceae bacterium]|nr:amidase domain-containing protein [Ktedonobacteraceae bacterium]